MKIFTTLLALIITVSLFAQNSPMADLAPNSVTPNEYSEEGGHKETSTGNEFVRKPKKLPANFTGYRIQLASSHVALNGKHAIFQSFGNITLEKKETLHCYTVGEFKSLKQAVAFVKMRIGDKFPDYSIIEYQDSVRVNEDVDFTAY